MPDEISGEEVNGEGIGGDDKGRESKTQEGKNRTKTKADENPSGFFGPAPAWMIWMGGSLLFVVLVLTYAARDWCFMPLLGGAFFAYYRFRETPVLILALVIFALVLTRLGFTPESLLAGWEANGPGPALQDDWLLAIALLIGVLGCAHASQMANAPQEGVVRGGMQSWLTQLVWILAPVLFLSIVAYHWILGEPQEFLRKYLQTELDARRARLLGLAFFGGGGIVIYTLIRGTAHGSSLTRTEALGSLYEVVWRQTRLEQSRIQQWLVAARRRKG